jgi:hypothetical protein
MRKQSTTRAKAFGGEEFIFGACEPDSMTLVLVLEARDFDEASARVDSVAPLLGVKVGYKLVVVQLEEMPGGVPTFLNAFFASGKVGFSRGNVAPGTTTLQ